MATSNESGLQVVLCGRRLAAREPPPPAKCPHCKSWRQRCLELESALEAAKHKLSQLISQRPRPVASKALQTELVAPTPMQTSCGSQTLKFACGRCRGAGMPPDVADVAAQAEPRETRELGLQVKMSTVLTDSVATQASVLRNAMASQTSPRRSVRRDVGCYVAMVDEQHAHQRQTLLSKIDNLLSESERMSAELTSAQNANSKMRLEMERLLCSNEAPEPLVGSSSGCPRLPKPQASGEKRRRAAENPFMAFTEETSGEPPVHDKWMEFVQGPLQEEELGARIGKCLSARSTPRRSDATTAVASSPPRSQDESDGGWPTGSAESESWSGSPRRADWRPRCSAVGTTLLPRDTPAVQQLVSTGAGVISAGRHGRASSLRAPDPRPASGKSGPESSRVHQETGIRRHPLVPRRSI